MEELYTIMYQIIDFDDEYYQYEPCYVIKGFMKDGLFVDELENSRLPIDNPMSIEDGVCIGKIYTKKEVLENYPEVSRLEDGLRQLFKEEEKLFIYGYYDNDTKKMEIYREQKPKKDEGFVDIYKDERDIFDLNSLDDIRMLIKDYKKQHNGEEITSVIVTFPLELLEQILEDDNTRENKDVKQPKALINDKDLLSFINSGLGELNNLVGLEKVKKSIKGLIATVIFKEKTKENLSFENDSKHMIFTGSPGTGKTTVAEIIAPMLYRVGYLRSPKVKYVAAQDLVGKYVGHTAPKTEAVIEEAKGGIIVLDEAYILAGDAQDFGNEAVTVILKEMEKNDTMFIFAGYKDEMKRFVDMNSGIKSRIGKYLQFDDYSPSELFEMFKKTMSNISKNSEHKLIVTEDVEQKVNEIISDAVKIKNFGNGRFIKNLCNMIISQHALNTYASDDIKELYTITPQDIPEDIFEKLFFDSKKKTVSIGFSADNSDKPYVKKKM